jgi:hypothetical protein
MVFIKAGIGEPIGLFTDNSRGKFENLQQNRCTFSGFGVLKGCGKAKSSKFGKEITDWTMHGFGRSPF